MTQKINKIYFFSQNKTNVCPVPCQPRWRMEANGRAASAAMFTSTNCACGTGHSRGFFRHFDFMTMDEAKTRRTSTFKQKQEETNLRTSTQWMKNKHDGRASLTFGTSFNSRDEHYMDLDLHEKSLWEEDGNEDNMAALEVHQRGGDVNPYPTNQ